ATPWQRRVRRRADRDVLSRAVHRARRDGELRSRPGLHRRRRRRARACLRADDDHRHDRRRIGRPRQPGGDDRAGGGAQDRAGRRGDLRARAGRGRGAGGARRQAHDPGRQRRSGELRSAGGRGELPRRQGAGGISRRGAGDVCAHVGGDGRRGQPGCGEGLGAARHRRDARPRGAGARPDDGRELQSGSRLRPDADRRRAVGRGHVPARLRRRADHRGACRGLRLPGGDPARSAVRAPDRQARL
ncbi:MAG: hypothetical protein AVDCRST_MAG67-2566, partial [uncultured Solirubrobacteraceae bacterium]